LLLKIATIIKKTKVNNFNILHPQHNVDLSCLEECISDTNPRHYEAITAGEYLADRLEKIGLKKVPAKV